MKLTKPKLNKAGLVTADIKQLAADATLERVAIAHADASSKHIKHLSLDEAGGRMTGLHLSRSTIKDVVGA